MSFYARMFDTKEEEDAYYNSKKPPQQTKSKPLSPYVGKPLSTSTIAPRSSKPTTAEDLYKARGATQWIVENFGASGALVLLAADSGTGKTTLMYQMANAISSGGMLMSQLKTQRKKVLFVQADESRRNAGEKISLMNIHGDNIHFRFAEDSSLWASLDIGHVSDQINLYGYGAIFMDSITTLLSDHSMNDPEFAKPLYELNRLAGEYNILIVMSAHLRKPEAGQKRREVSISDVMGSATQAGAVSDIWGLWPAQQAEFEDHFVLGCLGKRNCEKGTRWHLQGSKEDYTWELVSASNDDLLPTKKRELKDRLLTLLSQSKELLGIKQIAAALQCNEEHARRLAKDLVLANQISRQQQRGITGRPTYLYGSFPTPGDTPKV